MTRYLMAAAALTLAGCTPLAVSSVPTPPAKSDAADVGTVVAEAGDAVVLKGKRSFALAQNAYQGVSAALVPIVKAGLLSQAQLDSLDQLNDQALRLIERADAVRPTADRAAELFGIVAKLDQLKEASR